MRALRKYPRDSLVHGTGANLETLGKRPVKARSDGARCSTSRRSADPRSTSTAFLGPARPSRGRPWDCLPSLLSPASGASAGTSASQPWPETDTEHGGGLLSQACYALRRDLHAPLVRFFDPARHGGMRHEEGFGEACPRIGRGAERSRRSRHSRGGQCAPQRKREAHGQRPRLPHWRAGRGGVRRGQYHAGGPCCDR